MKDITDKDVYIAVDMSVPVVIGNCPTCNCGSRSLILINYSKRINYLNGVLHIKCVNCYNTFKTTIEYVSR
jgi:hypothetical protein